MLQHNTQEETGEDESEFGEEFRKISVKSYRKMSDFENNNFGDERLSKPLTENNEELEFLINYNEIKHMKEFLDSH